jgi:succinate dehydrogenase/fumarate reductase cytochrome b subunit
MQRKPSLIHIASLAQSLRGKYQFFTTAPGLPIWRKKITVLLYVLWKIIGFVIYFVFPVVALWQAHRDFAASGLLQACNLFFTWIAILALGQVLLLDFLYAITIFKQLLEPTC